MEALWSLVPWCLGLAALLTGSSGDFGEPADTEATAKFVAKVQAASAPIVVVDNAGKITCVNSAAERMFACGESPVNEFISPRFLETSQAHLQEMEGVPAPLHLLEAPLTFEGKRRNGEVFALEAVVSRAVVAGQLLVFAVLTDVSARDQIERTAVELAAIIASSEDAIIGKNLNGVVTSWNRGAENVFGYSSQEMVGHSILRLIPEDRLSEEAGILERLRRGEKLEHYETVRQRQDGALIDVSVTISPI